jgi:hypothetical protein
MATALVTSPFASMTDAEVSAWGAQALLEEAASVACFYYREGYLERVASLVEEAIAEAIASGDADLMRRAGLAGFKVQGASKPKGGGEWLYQALVRCATEA